MKTGNNIRQKECTLVIVETNKMSNVTIYTPTGTLHVSRKSMLFNPYFSNYSNRQIYITDSSSITLGDYFIQMDGGDKKPILRKYVTQKEFDDMGGVLGGYEKFGFYPITFRFNPIALKFPVINKKVIAATHKLSSTIPTISNDFIEEVAELYNNSDKKVVREVYMDIDFVNSVMIPIVNKYGNVELSTFKLS